MGYREGYMGVYIAFALLFNTVALAEGAQIAMDIEISNSPLYFDQLFINPDDAELQEGIFLITPFPGETRNITVYADIRDKNGFTDIKGVYLVFNGTNISMQQKFVGDVEMGFYEAIVLLPFYYKPGNDTLRIIAEDSGGAVVEGLININVVPVVSLSLDTTTLSLQGTTLEPLIIQGDEDVMTPSSPTLKNTGNVPLQVQLKGNDFFDGAMRIEAAAWLASLNSEGFNGSSIRLDYLYQDMNVVLKPNETLPLWLQLDTAEGIASGHYLGNISIAGVAS
ncbi:hypothetical protein HZB01_04815 [Candidatus Woesearchaeota archaeon]|nr:hypothetical protein [Candidatus Woesearchaeota archaeon]